MTVREINGRFGAWALGAAAAVTLMASALVYTVHGQGLPACDPDNGGITLPAGFCALVVADNLGAARHMAVAANGDLYVALMTSGGRGQPQTGGGAVALRDANKDGKFEVVERFGSGSTTGIALRNGYVYLAHPQVDRALQDDRRHAEADRCGRDDRQRPARRAAARGQGHCLRRPWRSLHQRGRAVERLPGSGSPSRREGRGPVPDSREARGHLEVRREQAEPDAGTGHALRHRPPSDAGDYLARRRALRRDEQPRSTRRVLAKAVLRARTTPSVRPSRSIARCRGRTSGGRTATTTTRPR